MPPLSQSLCLLLLCLAACEGSKSAPDPAAATVPSGSDEPAKKEEVAPPSSGAAPEVAAPEVAAPEVAAPEVAREPPGHLVIVAAVLSDGAPPLALGPGQTANVPLAVAIELRSEVALADVRIRLLDEAGKLVPSDDHALVGAGTRYRLAPREPLVPGSLYRLLVDGLSSELPAGADGRLYEEVSFAFQTAGEKPRPPPPPARKRHGGRRR